MTIYEARTRRMAIRRISALTCANDGVAEGTRLSWNTPIRHKVFVSYHAEDAAEVLDFIEGHTDVFIPRAIGMEEDGSDIIDSENVPYIRQTIKQNYLRDSTVTLVLIGECTWARKFVDWEIYSSLRSDPTPSGLLAVQCHYYVPPPSRDVLRGWIEEAFNARCVLRELINVRGPLRQRNSLCSR